MLLYSYHRPIIRTLKISVTPPMSISYGAPPLSLSSMAFCLLMEGKPKNGRRNMAWQDFLDVLEAWMPLMLEF